MIVFIQKLKNQDRYFDADFFLSIDYIFWLKAKTSVQRFCRKWMPIQALTKQF